jgi:adenylate cyclase
MAKQSDHDQQVEQLWRSYLTEGESATFAGLRFGFKDFRRLMRLLPTDPRCTVCQIPFEGVGATLLRSLFGVSRSRLNPQWCSRCEQFAEKHQGGAEVELSMLFADLRGSTSLAESMSPSAFSQLIKRFYQVTTDLMVETDALVEQLVGDEVAGLYVPGLAGPAHAQVALEAARAILRATGYGAPEEPWAPVGIGVHTGVAFVGAVGSQNGVTTITALGDAVNTTSRLASQAGPGEILVSEAASRAAELDTAGLEFRLLQLKGRSEPVGVHVVRVATL